jgi:hypothetical protein
VVFEQSSANATTGQQAQSAKAVIASRIAFLVNVRGICEVDFVLMGVSVWFYYFFAVLLSPMFLLNTRINGELFIETFMKHSSRTETWQIHLEKSEAEPRHGAELHKR